MHLCVVYLIITPALAKLAMLTGKGTSTCVASTADGAALGHLGTRAAPCVLLSKHLPVSYLITVYPISDYSADRVSIVSNRLDKDNRTDTLFQAQQDKSSEPCLTGQPVDSSVTKRSYLANPVQKRAVVLGRNTNMNISGEPCKAFAACI